MRAKQWILVAAFSAAFSGVLLADEQQAAERLARWQSAYEAEVAFDSEEDDFTLEYTDEVRQGLYALVNDLGGVFEDGETRREITHCGQDMLALFTVPTEQDGVKVPGVLLFKPFRRTTDYATLFVIDERGHMASAAIDFTTLGGAGGVYTVDQPGVVLSSADPSQEGGSVYRWFRPGPDLEAPLGSGDPVVWTEEAEPSDQARYTGAAAGSDERGGWVRLDDLGRAARQKR